MIIKIDDMYHSRVIKYLKYEPDFNLGIIGDIERYGYDNNFLEVWAGLDKRKNIEGVLVKYFGYLTFYSRGKFNINSFCDLINKLDYLELSGKSQLLEKLYPKLNIKNTRMVKFCILEDTNKLYRININEKVKKIRFGNITKVVRLYEKIEEFENTNIESLKNSLKTGRGYCIEYNRQVVAMAKSTLENRTHAMIVGVATHPSYRNRGFATKCVVKICNELLKEGKIPCLFYDNEEAGKIYENIGFKEKGYWSIYSR